MNKVTKVIAAIMLTVAVFCAAGCKKDPAGSLNGHGYVDLGLPSGTMWATCNVGADTPEGFGDYFAWGETQPKDNYGWGSYLLGTDYDKLTKYCGKPEYGYNGFSDGLTALLPKDDAATFNWGNGWRTPTKEEWQELFDHTAHRWTAQEGMLGRLFTADNGNSIFLPACGYFKDSDVMFAGSGGEYWSSTLDTVEPCFGLFSETGNGSHVYVSSYGRIYGMPVRAVYSSR